MCSSLCLPASLLVFLKDHILTEVCHAGNRSQVPLRREQSVWGTQSWDTMKGKELNQPGSIGKVPEGGTGLF